MFPSVATFQFAFLSVPTVHPGFCPNTFQFSLVSPTQTLLSGSHPTCAVNKAVLRQVFILTGTWPWRLPTIVIAESFAGQPPTYTHRACFLSRCLERSSFSQGSAQMPPSLEWSLDSSLHPNHNCSLPPLCSDNSYPILTLLCGHFGYSPILSKIKKLLEGRKGS